MSRRKTTASTRASQAREKANDARYKRQVAKLQKAGLLGDINKRKKRDPKAQRAIVRFTDFLKGKVAAVKTKVASLAKTVAEKFGFRKRGNVVLVPREKHERVSINKQGEIVSKRPNPINKSQTVTRTMGAPLAPPKPGEKIYYTIRERKRGLGRIKRTTFSKFDDLLEYLAAYELNWDDVEKYFETEYVSEDKAATYDETIHEEQRAAYRRHKRRKARKNKRTR